MPRTALSIRLLSRPAKPPFGPIDVPCPRSYPPRWRINPNALDIEPIFSIERHARNAHSPGHTATGSPSSATLTFRPVPSSSSRAAATTSSSPGATPPPGVIHSGGLSSRGPTTRNRRTRPSPSSSITRAESRRRRRLERACTGGRSVIPVIMPDTTRVWLRFPDRTACAEHLRLHLSGDDVLHFEQAKPQSSA